MSILSIQSRVAFGHVGNAAAVFPLQRLGFEVWPVDTVSFSNHLGYKTWRGRTHPASEVAAVVDGLELLGLFPRCEAVLSGYLGEAATATVVRDAVARVRAANPEAIYLCDPVMGDRDGGMFVKPEVRQAFLDLLLHEADIIVPNAYELEALTGGDATTLEGALAAADRLRAELKRKRGKAARRRAGTVVVCTGLLRRDGPADRIGTLAVADDGAWLATTPFVRMHVHGTGDTLAALLLGHFLKTGKLATALGRAVAGLHKVIEETAAADRYELTLIKSQDAMIAPRPPLRPRRLR
jgi:pyridoxine kinase